MELETSTMPPKVTRLTEEDDALASQVLEIIGGITLGALQTLEDPGERDVWSMEEGDDSVFYSDEDQAHQDINPPCGFGANEYQRLVNSVAADEQQELQTPKTEPVDQSDPADPGAQSTRTPEKSVSTCGESLNCTVADLQTQQNISAEKVNLPVEKEEVTPNLEPFDVTNEKSNTRLNVEPDVPEQMSSTNVPIEQDHNVHVPVGFHQDPSPGYSTLPLPKKSCGGHQRSFNHLSSSKYSTVSYRKIRRGNTRQKIEEFEYMIMNL